MEDMKKTDNPQGTSRQQLFSGNGVRDASVSEMEKLAEASFIIRAESEKLADKYRNK